MHRRPKPAARPDPVGPAGPARHFAPAAFVTRQQGWRRGLLAFALGVLAALAMPPVHAVPVLLVAFPGLLWLIESSRGPGRAFLIAWAFGTGHFAAGFYWLSHALLIEPEKFGWLIPFATLGLGGLVGLFVGLSGLAVRAARTRGAASIGLLAAAWLAGEWLRSWVLTGFPWNLLGTVWAFSDAMLQGAMLAGVYGLGLVTVLAAAAPALAAESPRRGALATLAGLGLLAALGLGGAARLNGAETAMVEGVTLRLVQASIAQGQKWQAELRERHLAEQVRLSRGEGFDRVTHVVWPESAAPFFLDADAARRRVAAAAVPPGGLLLTGAPRATPEGEAFRVWNSLVVVDGQAHVAGLYDKVHLVPFGEYVPFRGVLPLAKITQGATDFSSGAALATLELPGLPPVGPLICYEAIFPGRVTAPGRRPAWLLNLTNDGWFGISAGPHQHLAAARLRAVEEGLPLVRAANTGISAVADGYGRVIAELGLGERGVLDAPLPRALAPTPYARFGNLVPLSLAGLLAGVSLAARRRYPRSP